MLKATLPIRVISLPAGADELERKESQLCRLNCPRVIEGSEETASQLQLDLGSFVIEMSSVTICLIPFASRSICRDPSEASVQWRFIRVVREPSLLQTICEIVLVAIRTVRKSTMQFAEQCCRIEREERLSHTMP